MGKENNNLEKNGSRLVVCFDDKAKEKKPITLENPNEEYLKELNEKGYGIFETANSFYATEEQLLTTGKKTKRNKEFLVCLNEVFADLDVCKDSDRISDEKREKQKTGLKVALEKYCPASVYVITKNGLQPRWWLTEPNIDKTTKQEYVNIINGIIEWSKQHKANGDPVKDVTRVLRKPGYYHHKSKPYLITEEKGSGKNYTLAELKKYFWSESVVPTKKIDNSVTNQIDSIDIRTVVIDVWKEKGSEASFDKDDHLIVDGEVTATFKGRLGGNYIATSSSDYPAKGNAVTYVAEILSISTKEAHRWLCEKYKNETDENSGKITIEALEKMLKAIPQETAPVKLLEVLTPIFEKLILIEKITAENFILNNIKEHFCITKEDAKKYISHINLLRIKSVKEKRGMKEKKNSLPLILDRDIDFQEAYVSVRNIGIVSAETLKLITAIVISSQLRPNPPLWLFLIGVPSSFKTELVGLYSDMDTVYTLDTMTENAFASGYVPSDGSEPQDLLPLLDNKVLIIKDLNTLFSMNEEMVKKILGDLTSIFDGKFQKFTATRGMVEYNSLFSMIGCITPSILVKHYNYATRLGARFLFLRIPELTEEELQKGFTKSWSETNRAKEIISTRQIVSSYSTQLIKKIKGQKIEPASEKIQQLINDISRFICKARGIAITNKTSFLNENGKNVDFYEITDWQVEHPWRILNQLKSVLPILSVINGNNTVSEEEIRLIKPIILSTMPIDRAEVLGILTDEYGLSAKNLSNRIRKSPKTIRRTMKALCVLGITDCYKDSESAFSFQSPWLFFIREEFCSILGAPVPPRECLSLRKSTMEETSDDIDEDDFN